MKLKLLLLLSVSLGLSIQAQEQQFTTLGLQSFTAPQSVVTLSVECVGAGGAGGRVTPSNIFDDDAAGGGGGGAYAKSILPVVSGDLYDVFVGKGGKNDGSSLDGEDSYFGSATLIKAAGGLTRPGNDNEPGVGGGQANSCVGDVRFSGGNGGNGDESDADGGGGGGAAGSMGPGINGSNLLAGGNTNLYGGAGGAGGSSGATGATGNNYGGGGGGSSAQGSNDRNGGQGAGGIVVVKWMTITGLSTNLVCATANDIVTISGTNLSTVDSLSLNGQLVTFNIVNATTIEAEIDTSLYSGVFIVHSEVGSSQSDSIEIVRNSVTLSNNMNFLSATYTGDSLAANWYWYDCVNNDTIDIDSIGTLTVEETGVYGVYVEENACIVQSACVVVAEIYLDTTTIIDTTVIDTTTSIRDVINTELFSLYPNPSEGILNVTIANNQDIEAIKVYDLNGKLVFVEGKSFDTNHSIDLSALNPGIYFLEVRSQSDTGVAKLVLK